MGPGRFLGRIKSFNPRHGFGFIDCPDARSRFSRDVFIHKAQMGDLDVGMEITFSVEPNRDGMPQARDILKLDGRTPGPTPFEKSWDEGKGPSESGSKGKPENGPGHNGNSGKGFSKGGSSSRRRGGKGRRKTLTDGKGAPIEEGEES